MRPILAPQLLNGPRGDPALFVDVMFHNRALLFDLGDLANLSAKKMLRLSDVFVSHTHMDHFVGFDALLRTSLGRPKTLRLWGGPGFTDRVAAKLSAYTWNLVANYAADFTLETHEVHPGGEMIVSRFCCRQGFSREPLRVESIAGDLLVDETQFWVRFRFLDHGIPCLAFAIGEKLHVNIWKNRLQELGLSTGPWLKKLKDAVAENLPGGTKFAAPERVVTLDELKIALRIIPGQKIAYVTDAAGSAENLDKMISLAADADIFFLEAVFLHRDHELAEKRRHLTARQAGEIGRAAGAKRIVPFHFSPRYDSGPGLIEREVEEAFSNAA